MKFQDRLKKESRADLWKEYCGFLELSIDDYMYIQNRLMEEQIGDCKNDVFFITHGDCIDDAKFLAGEVQKRFGIKENMIHFVCPTIGAHSGPGTVALFFLGEKR